MKTKPKITQQQQQQQQYRQQERKENENLAKRYDKQTTRNSKIVKPDLSRN